MVRKLRVEYSGALYHVMNRGDRREPIFKDDWDREIFMETSGEVCAKTGWEVHWAALRIARGVDVGASSVGGESRGIEHAVVVRQAAGPGALTIGVGGHATGFYSHSRSKAITLQNSHYFGRWLITGMLSRKPKGAIIPVIDVQTLFSPFVESCGFVDSNKGILVTASLRVFSCRWYIWNSLSGSHLTHWTMSVGGPGSRSKAKKVGRRIAGAL
jgi:hypothetical protein